MIEGRLNSNDVIRDHISRYERKIIGLKSLLVALEKNKLSKEAEETLWCLLVTHTPSAY